METKSVYQQCRESRPDRLESSLMSSLMNDMKKLLPAVGRQLPLTKQI
jgi:hypothetical protein